MAKQIPFRAIGKLIDQNPYPDFNKPPTPAERAISKISKEYGINRSTVASMSERAYAQVKVRRTSDARGKDPETLRQAALTKPGEFDGGYGTGPVKKSAPSKGPFSKSSGGSDEYNRDDIGRFAPK
jgi:hypothetical protein